MKDKAVALEHEVVKDALKLEHEVVKDAKAGAKAVAKGAVALEHELVKDVKAVEKELVKDGKAVAKAVSAGPLPSEEQAAKDEDEREAARLKQRDALQKKAEKQVCPLQLILPPAPGVSNEGGSSSLLALVLAVSRPWASAWGSLEPPRRDGENAQKTGKNGEKMGEIRSKKCEQGKDRRDQLARIDAAHSPEL